MRVREFIGTNLFGNRPTEEREFWFDVKGALLILVLLIIPTLLSIYFMGSEGMLVWVAVMAAILIFLNTDFRVTLVFLLLPVSSFQITEGLIIYLVFDSLFVFFFLSRLVFVEKLLFTKVPVLSWLVLMIFAYAPSLLNSPDLKVSMNSINQFLISGFTAWGVFFYVQRSRIPYFPIILSRLFLYEGGCVTTWGLLQTMLRGSISQITSGRAFIGYFGDPNYYAVYLVCILSIGFAFVFFEQRRVLKLIAGLISVLAGISIVATVSRAGIVIMLFIAICFGMYAVVLFQGRRKRIVINSLASTVAVVGVLLFSSVGNKLVNIVVLVNRVTDALSGTDASVGQRSKIFEVTWRAVEEHPIIGVGFGSIEEVFDEYKEGLLSTGSKRSVHNTGFRILAETGIIGLIPSLAFAASLLLFLWRGQKHARLPSSRAIIFGFLMTIISFFGTSLTLDQLNSFLFWPLCGLSLAITLFLQGNDNLLLPS